MKQIMIKTITLCVLFTLFAQAEMKCEAGKCSTGDDNSPKVIPEKPSVKIEENKNKRVIEQLFNVTTVKVKQLSTAKEQVNYGYIVVEDSRRVEVSSWYSGYVEALYADTVYKRVEIGEALVKVYSPEVYKAKQDYLNAIKFNAQRATLGMLRGAKEKLRLLNVSKKEINLIKSTRKVDEYTTIYAPISGWIFSKNLNLGSSFKKQQKLFEIVNLDKVWLEAKLFQNQIKDLKKLKNFNVKVDGIDTVFKAEKTLLYPKIDSKEATVTLRLLLDNCNDELKPGMYAKLHSTAKSSSKLVIPRTAALRKDGKWYAFLATDFKGEYEPVEIDIEPLDNVYFVVKKGLSENETVVNNALFMMDSDAQINSIY